MTAHDHHPLGQETPYTAVEIATAMLRGGSSVLQVGSQPGLESHADLLGCRMVALVADPESCDVLRTAGHEAHLVDLDDPELLDPLDGRLFDHIVALHVLDVAADPAGLLRRLTKHMAPDGHLVLSLRNATYVDDALSSLRGRLPHPATHGRPTHLFDRSSIEVLLGSAGLSAIDVVELHRRADLDTAAGGAIPPDVLRELTQTASTVREWIVAAATSPRELPSTLTRRLLGDALERACALDASSALTRSYDERMRALEDEHRNEVERLHTELATLHEELDDALRLEREVEWQRELIATIGVRLEACEQRLPKVEQDYANAMALVAATQHELTATRRRVGFVLMDRIAQRVMRHKVLSLVIVAPLRRIISSR